MEKKNNKTLFIILSCTVLVIVIIVIGIFMVKFTKSNIDNNVVQNTNDDIQENQIVSEEDIRKKEIENKEKQYKENNKYQCFKDETFGIRLYYNDEDLKYGSLIAQAGKLALQERKGDNMFLYSTNEIITKDYDKNALIQDFIQNQVKSGVTILENKDVTISKITPVQARYIESQTGNVIMKDYIIFKEKGTCKFSLGIKKGTKSVAIDEILDTIISE